MTRVAAGLVVLAWAASAPAQVSAPAPEALAVGDWRLVPVAEGRVYGEYRRDLDARDHGALLERARLGADLERGPVELRVVLQDARLWALGAGSPAVGQPSQIALTSAYETFVEAHTAGAHPSFVRVGRQAVTWGEGRLLGASDRSPTGRVLDAARARLTAGPWSFEALGASLSDPASGAGPTLAPAYGELAGARVEWGLDPLFGAELYGLSRFAQAAPDASLEGTVRGETHTGALRLHGEGAGWTWGAQGAAQLGRVADLRLDRQAWAVAAHVSHAFEHVLLSPTAGLGASYASGDHGGGKYTAFDPMLPDARTFYGAMDLFAWSNIEEASARASIVPWTDGLASVEYRYARLADAAGSWRSDYLATVTSAAPRTRAELGHEVDASIAWSPWPALELGAGYSALVVGAGARDALLAAHLAPPSVVHLAFGQATVRVP